MRASLGRAIRLSTLLQRNGWGRAAGTGCDVDHMWERGNEEGIEHACARDVSAMTTVLLANGIRLGEGATTRMARLHEALAADTEEVATLREPPLGGGGGHSSAEPERTGRNTRIRHGEASTQRASATRSTREGKRRTTSGGEGRKT